MLVLTQSLASLRYTSETHENYKPNGTELGWECDLRIELSVVQSRAPLTPRLVKKHQKAPNPNQKSDCNALNKGCPGPH